MEFFLGTHETSWLKKTSVPLFVSMNRLDRLKSFPYAVGKWALDSGGFTELSKYGEWRTDAKTYAAKVKRAAYEIGNLAWASPQDWMCEPWIVQKTGLSVEEHQLRTVQNFLELRSLPTGGVTIIPVLQGWYLEDYLRHAEMYALVGVDLLSEPTVGVGSVCRRQSHTEAGSILLTLNSMGFKNLHGFGFKIEGIRQYGNLLKSADSMAWSYSARMSAPLDGCTHKSCSNCMRYAMLWRSRIESGRQMFLF